MPPTADPRTSASPMRLGRLVVASVALLSAGAGLIHLGVAGQHLSHPALVAGFIGMGLAQFALAGTLVLRGTRVALGAAAAMNLAILGLWTVTRTTALPWIPGLEAAQAVGVADLVATMLEVALVAAAGIGLLLPAGAAEAPVLAAQRILAGVASAVVVLAIPGLIAPHAHSSHDTAAHAAGPGHAVEAVDGHGHDPMTWEQAHDVLSHGHAPTTAEHGPSALAHLLHAGMPATGAHGHAGTSSEAMSHEHAATGEDAGHAEHASVDQARPEQEVMRFGQGQYLAYEPATKDGEHGSAFRWHDAQEGAGHHAYDGECRPTAEQQASADEIARSTAASLRQYKNNPWRALADGFVAYPIPVWKMFHMVSVGRFEDGHTLNAKRIESFMYMMTNEGLVAVGGMFIFPDKEATPPNPTGCLLVWHQHTGGEGLVTSFDPQHPGESVWMAHVWAYGGLDPWGRDFDGTEPYTWFFAYRYVPAVCAEDGECI